MFSREPQIAPARECVRYLAIFQRMFVAVDAYTRQGDIAGMLLGGWLADALHNVPALLWHYGSNTWSPEQMAAWMQAFPDHLRRFEAPDRLVRDSKRILAPGNAARDLGQSNDLSDLNVAPLPRMRVYLEIFYEACLTMRGIRNYGVNPYRDKAAAASLIDHATVSNQAGERPRRAPWRGLEGVWTKEAQAYADFNARLAKTLIPVPQALVRWSQFDEAAFIHSASGVIAPAYLDEASP